VRDETEEGRLDGGLSSRSHAKPTAGFADVLINRLSRNPEDVSDGAGALPVPHPLETLALPGAQDYGLIVVLIDEPPRF
jgi:hypothetical protein